MPIEDIVDQVGVNLNAWEIETTKGRDAKVTNASGRGADQNDLVFECAWRKCFLCGVSEGNVWVCPGRPMKVHKHPAHIVGMNRELMPKFDIEDSPRAIAEHGLLSGEGKVDTQRLHINGGIHVPISVVRVEPVWERKGHMANDPICVDDYVEIPGAARFGSHSACEQVAIRFGTAWYESSLFIFFD